MIPQAKDNESLTLIKTQQVDDNLDTYSKEARIRRGTSRGKPTTPALLPTSPHTLPSLVYKVALKVDSPRLLLLQSVLCVNEGLSPPYIVLLGWFLVELYKETL